MERVHGEREWERVRTFLEDLPARQREALELVDLRGLSAVEAAGVLELAPGTVRAHLFRARRALRRKLVRPSLETENG